MAVLVTYYVFAREALLVLAFPPLALFVTGLCCAGFGYLLLNAAGAVDRAAVKAAHGAI